MPSVNFLKNSKPYGGPLFVSVRIYPLMDGQNNADRIKFKVFAIGNSSLFVQSSCGAVGMKDIVRD